VEFDSDALVALVIKTPLYFDCRKTIDGLARTFYNDVTFVPSVNTEFSSGGFFPGFSVASQQLLHSHTQKKAMANHFWIICQERI
jgi:hypothetical protein